MWGGGGGAVGEVSGGVDNADTILHFPSPWVDMMANKEATMFGAGMRRMARKSGRARCSSRHTSVVHPLLRSAPTLSIDVEEVGGGGVQSKHVRSLGKIFCAAACCSMLLPAHVGTYASVGN